MSFNIHWKGSNVIVSFTGNFTYNDSFEVNNLIYGDSRFDSMKYQIADFSKIEKFEFTEDEIKIISTLEKTSTVWNNSVKVAVIDSDTISLSAIIDPYIETMKTTNWEIKVFNNLDEAMNWCSKEG
jgi:hypothetical protein